MMAATFGIGFVDLRTATRLPDIENESHAIDRSIAKFY